MPRMLLAVPLLALVACSSDEPSRPSAEDEARFHEIEGMLDEEQAEASPNEEGAAPEDATPSQESDGAGAD